MHCEPHDKWNVSRWTRNVLRDRRQPRFPNHVHNPNTRFTIPGRGSPTPNEWELGIKCFIEFSRATSLTNCPINFRYLCNYGIASSCARCSVSGSHKVPRAQCLETNPPAGSEGTAKTFLCCRVRCCQTERTPVMPERTCFAKRGGLILPLCGPRKKVSVPVPNSTYLFAKRACTMTCARTRVIMTSLI